MIKKATLFFVLSAFLILIGGCETIKGAFEGAKRDWESATGRGTALKNADEWMQKNLW